MVDLLIPGPEGKIEAKYSHNNRDDSPIVILLHPDPSKGGTMHTKIIFKMYKIFIKAGFSTIRFNFRGVGRSVGTFDNGEGELADAASAMDWLQSQNPTSNTSWISGFSFGSWIGMQLMMRRPEITGFISISPPASTHDFSFLAPCPASGLIVQGKDNDLVPASKVENLVERISKQKGISIEISVIEGANHFFTSHLDEAMTSIDNYLDKTKDGKSMPTISD